jgi:hypothetical protein
LNHFLLESGTHFQGRSPDNEAMRSSRSWLIDSIADAVHVVFEIVRQTLGGELGLDEPTAGVISEGHPPLRDQRSRVVYDALFMAGTPNFCLVLVEADSNSTRHCLAQVMEPYFH